MSRWQIMALLALAAALAATMLGVVAARQESRKLFIELQQVQQVLDEQEVRRTRLQLEQSTLADIARVKRIARQELNMHEPQTVQVLPLPDKQPGGAGHD